MVFATLISEINVAKTIGVYNIPKIKVAKTIGFVTLQKTKTKVAEIFDC